MPNLADIVSFRRDLLFNGAVQLGWLETDRPLAEKAAQHFAFHGPRYHGVARDASQADGHQLVDTASFTLDLLRRLSGRRPGEPFALAVAGYGTGKSHLGVTLASLLGAPHSALADRIVANLHSAEPPIGDDVRTILGGLGRPFLVVALNGMKDFDLTAEVVRQVMVALRERGLDASPLEDLRPRFKQAIGYITEEIFHAFEDEFRREFGAECRREEILERLSHQDEVAFHHVYDIFDRKMGMSIRAAGQESIHDFLRVVRETYCGEDKPFAGLLILFDEFGRYMEFAVHRPLIAGSGALQQLYEAVQANGEGVFLLSFIQYELRAYVSRVAPELRDELERYVSRYDGVRKVRLSTNLETLIANLLQKKDPDQVDRHVAAPGETSVAIHGYMKRWFPEMDNHAVWANPETFDRVIRRGCWPLHPLSTWLLFKLASVGKSLHQRSALSLLADVYERYQDIEPVMGFSLAPADLCSEDLISEFVASEQFGQQGPSAQAFQAVVARDEHILSEEETRILKAVLLLAKTGARIPTQQDWPQALALFGGCSEEAAPRALHSLLDRGALTWNDNLGQYEILSDGISRAKFLAFLEGKVAEIPAHRRGELFSANFGKWFPELAGLTTDFGVDNEIATREWNYAVSFGNVSLLPSQIEIALRNWPEARAVDEAKGRLLYCCVGPESDLTAVRAMAEARLRACLENTGVPWDVGAPIAVSLLHDEDGSFASKVAEYWLLRTPMDPTDAQRFANFVPDRQDSLEQELRDQFEQLRRKRHLVLATAQPITGLPLKLALTRLFDAVYSQRIPFPFDGFGVAGGTAARCNQQFTRQLFLGQFDREWIATRAVQEKNRAHQVMVESWQVLDADGRLRIRPGNQAVQRLVDLFDSWLQPGPAEASGQFNLGKALRTLCAPPYGCNLASAGLVLALFFGGRKDSVGLLKGGQRIATESWLQAAMPRNYLELPVLDQTVVLQVQAPDEWLRLLNDWGLETTHSGKVAYLRKARGLEDRVPIPQSLYHWYDNLRDKAQAAMAALLEHGNKLNEALQRVQSGLENGNLSQLSWGAADLTRLSTEMRANESLWTGEDLAEVQRPLADARVAVQLRFPLWLPHQRETSIAGLADWVRRMERVTGNLSALGLADEQAALRRHIEEVQSVVQFLEEVRNLTLEIRSFIRGNPVTDSTPITTLTVLVSKVAGFEDLVAQARLRNVEAVRADLDVAQGRLGQFKQECRQQIEAHKRLLEDAYNWRVLTLSDVSDLRAKAASLRQVFVGQERDLAGIGEIARELEIVESDYRQLDSDSLNDEEFDALLHRDARAMETLFEGEPPLFNDPYEGIAATLRAARRHKSEEWMRTNVPTAEAINAASATQVQAFKSRLQNSPRLLSDGEARLVREHLAACEHRLDLFEVEGMLARFGAIPELGRKSFLEGIWARGLLANLCRQVACKQSSPACYQDAWKPGTCKCPLFHTGLE